MAIQITQMMNVGRLQYRVPIKCNKCTHIGFQYYYWNGQQFIEDTYDKCKCGKDHAYQIIGLPEQFTGLRDIYDVMIYDGDIVEAPHDFGPGGWVVKVFTVKYDNKKGYQWSYWDMDKAKVIGNKHLVTVDMKKLGMSALIEQAVADAEAVYKDEKEFPMIHEALCYLYNQINYLRDKENSKSRAGIESW